MCAALALPLLKRHVRQMLLLISRNIRLSFTDIKFNRPDDHKQISRARVDVLLLHRVGIAMAFK